jgi:hypothetical protein
MAASLVAGLAFTALVALPGAAVGQQKKHDHPAGGHPAGGHGAGGHGHHGGGGGGKKAGGNGQTEPSVDGTGGRLSDISFRWLLVSLGLSALIGVLGAQMYGDLLGPPEERTSG